MKLLSFYISMLMSICAYCQTENSDQNLTKDSDTVYWKSLQTEKIKEFKISAMNSQSEFVFRSWNPYSMLEVSKHNESISGKITYFVYEVWEDDNHADTFVKTYVLPNDIAKSLYEHILKSEFQNTPSDKYIKNWQQGLDGIVYVFELKQKNSYSFKKFWTPTSQKNIEEATFIIEFKKTISEIGKLNTYGKEFFKEIPFLHYRYSGSHYSIMKPVTKKALRRYKRDRKRRQRDKNKL